MKKDTSLEDFKKIVVWHTIKKARYFFKDVDRYLEAPLASKANHLAFPRGYLKRLCRRDSTTHTKDFCKQAGFIYHGKTRSGLPPWIEVPEQVLDEVWTKRKPWSAKSNYYTKRQQKWIAKYYEATRDGVKREFDRITKADDSTMTKAREEQIRRECAEGKHCLDADTLIKQEKKLERAAMKQKVSIAKRAAKETLSDYAKLQLELEMAKSEIKRLKALVNENADIPEDTSKMSYEEFCEFSMTPEYDEDTFDFEARCSKECIERLRAEYEKQLLDTDANELLPLDEKTMYELAAKLRAKRPPSSPDKPLRIKA